jgi:hypothetical protein
MPKQSEYITKTKFGFAVYSFHRYIPEEVEVYTTYGGFTAYAKYADSMQNRSLGVWSSKREAATFARRWVMEKIKKYTNNKDFER